MEAYLGTVCVFGFNFAPYGWALCQGQILPISQYAALFSLLGTTYGGNGTSSFGLPDLQGRVSLHMGQLSGGSLYTMGEFGGAETATVLLSNLPQHNHGTTVALSANAAGATSGTPGTNYAGSSTTDQYYNAATTGTMASFNITLGSSGGNTPISISDPSLVMNYCIAMQGIFPTRN
jgi:microcystin-dependent protein